MVITILLFLIWAEFALFVVNPILNADLPGYKIGRICIWEYIALTASLLGSFAITKFWGYPEVREIGKRKNLMLNIHYGYFFLGYVLLAVAFILWQFWTFSQKF